ncbi:MAG: non-canonical purine NTP pyrophosphatase [Holophagales bacterium]|nr:non-canonical purine NTP pyrophosphatase [Holophagales bacterium]
MLPGPARRSRRPAPRATLNAPVPRQSRLPHLERGEGARGGGVPREARDGPRARDPRDPVPRLRRGRHGQGSRGRGELGVPVLVEDSGLSLPAWKGYPGPLTKYAVGAVGEAGFARLAHAWGDPRAEAVSNLGLAWPGASPADVVVAEGRVAGTLAPEPRGANGFGWDVIFIPAGETRTFAEMSVEEKNARSHRAKAFAELAALLAPGE